MALHATLQAIDLDTLSLFHNNARRGDVPAIMKSLDINDQYSPITVNVGTLTGRPYEVLIGNNTLTAMRKLAAADVTDKRWQSIDCYVIDVDDVQATRINLNPNRLQQLGGFDDAILLELLSGFDGDLDGTGYIEQDLADLTALLGPMPSDITPVPEPSSAVDEPAAEPGTDTPAVAPGPRSIALGSLPPLYITWLHEKLATLAEEFNVPTTADVLVALIITHTGERPE